MRVQSCVFGALLTLLSTGPALLAQEEKAVPPAEGQGRAAEANPNPQAPLADAPVKAAEAGRQAPVEPRPANPLFLSVVVSKHPYYHGSGLFALGGALGGLMAAAAYKDEPDRIAAFVEQEHIDVGRMVSAEFERQLQATPAAKEKFSALKDVKFTMAILYGITSVPFSDYRPYLSVHMTSRDAAGAQQWKDREWVGGHGDAKSIPYPDFLKSAQVFTSEFEVAAKEVVALLIKDYAK